MLCKYGESYKRATQGKHRLAVAVIATIGLLASSNPSSLWAQDRESGPTEYDVKAAYLYNFAHFVQWPEEVLSEDTAYIKIGILGEDPFGEILDQIASGKTVNGKKLQVHRFKTVESLEYCHILFVCGSENARLNDIFKHIEGWNMLTVGETAAFFERGGMVNFIKLGNKVRFEISKKTTEKADLKISSRLLRLAVTKKAKAQEEELKS
jgi:hypothetical protein